MIPLITQMIHNTNKSTITASVYLSTMSLEYSAQLAFEISFLSALGFYIILALSKALTSTNDLSNIQHTIVYSQQVHIAESFYSSFSPIRFIRFCYHSPLLSANIDQPMIYIYPIYNTQ